MWHIPVEQAGETQFAVTFTSTNNAKGKNKQINKQMDKKAHMDIHTHAFALQEEG